MTFEEMRLKLRTGNKLVFQTDGGLKFAVGQEEKYGVYWTTVYNVDVFDPFKIEKSVKEYKNKLIDVSTLEDWFGQLTFMGLTDHLDRS